MNRIPAKDSGLEYCRPIFIPAKAVAQSKHATIAFIRFFVDKFFKFIPLILVVNLHNLVFDSKEYGLLH